jgi:CheY-like chemotaxis protein
MTLPAKSILIVDNDEDWLSLLERLLIDEGYGVLKAASCATAIAAASRARPDCVIADLKMGGESGLTVCSHLKNTPELSGIPFILLSGAEPEEGSCAWDAFVCKADGTAALLAAVKKALA